MREVSRTISCLYMRSNPDDEGTEMVGTFHVSDHLKLISSRMTYFQILMPTISNSILIVGSHAMNSVEIIRIQRSTDGVDRQRSTLTSSMCGHINKHKYRVLALCLPFVQEKLPESHNLPKNHI